MEKGERSPVSPSGSQPQENQDALNGAQARFEGKNDILEASNSDHARMQAHNSLDLAVSSSSQAQGRYAQDLAGSPHGKLQAQNMQNVVYSAQAQSHFQGQSMQNMASGPGAQAGFQMQNQQGMPGSTLCSKGVIESQQMQQNECDFDGSDVVS